MKTGYKTSKAPYVDIHYGDIVERYEGAIEEIVVEVDGHPFLQPRAQPLGEEPYPMLKIDRVLARISPSTADKEPTNE